MLDDDTTEEVKENGCMYLDILEHKKSTRVRTLGGNILGKQNEQWKVNSMVKIT